MSFGSRLKERREAVGMTQKDLGKLLGVSGNAIGNYEKGISSPNADILFKVFDVLQCSADYLFQDDVKQKKPAVREDDELDPAIADLILQYRAASPQQQRAALAAALAVLKSE